MCPSLFIITSLYSFTIQNVPIKLKREWKTKKDVMNLQYKMFLLNFFNEKVKIKDLKIYNTKCSY